MAKEPFPVICRVLIGSAALGVLLLSALYEVGGNPQSLGWRCEAGGDAWSCFVLHHLRPLLEVARLLFLLVLVVASFALAISLMGSGWRFIRRRRR